MDLIFIIFLVFILSSCSSQQDTDIETSLTSPLLEEQIIDNNQPPASSKKIIDFDTNLSIPREMTPDEQELFDVLMSKVSTHKGFAKDAITKFAMDEGLDENLLWDQWIEFQEIVQFQTHGNYPTMEADLIYLAQKMIAKNIDPVIDQFKNAVIHFDHEDDMVRVNFQLIIDEESFDSSISFKLYDNYQKAEIIKMVISEQLYIPSDDE